MKRLLSAVLIGLMIGCYSGLVSAQDETKSISGVVTSIDLDKKELVLEARDANTGNAQESAIKVNEATDIEYGLLLDDIIVGDELNIEYASDNTGANIAKNIKFVEEEAMGLEPEIEEEIGVAQ